MRLPLPEHRREVAARQLRDSRKREVPSLDRADHGMAHAGRNRLIRQFSLLPGSIDRKRRGDLHIADTAVEAPAGLRKCSGAEQELQLVELRRYVQHGALHGSVVQLQRIAPGGGIDREHHFMPCAGLVRRRTHDLVITPGGCVIQQDFQYLVAVFGVGVSLKVQRNTSGLQQPRERIGLDGFVLKF